MWHNRFLPLLTRAYRNCCIITKQTHCCWHLQFTELLVNSFIQFAPDVALKLDYFLTPLALQSRKPKLSFYYSLKLFTLFNTIRRQLFCFVPYSYSVSGILIFRRNVPLLLKDYMHVAVRCDAAEEFAYFARVLLAPLPWQQLTTDFSQQDHGTT
jgi:hypothetical protein